MLNILCEFMTSSRRQADWKTAETGGGGGGGGGRGGGGGHAVLTTESGLRACIRLCVKCLVLLIVKLELSMLFGSALLLRVGKAWRSISAIKLGSFLQKQMKLPPIAWPHNREPHI